MDGLLLILLAVSIPAHVVTVWLLIVLLQERDSSE